LNFVHGKTVSTQLSWLISINAVRMAKHASLANSDGVNVTCTSDNTPRRQQDNFTNAVINKIVTHRQLHHIRSAMSAGSSSICVQ